MPVILLFLLSAFAESPSSTTPLTETERVFAAVPRFQQIVVSQKDGIVTLEGRVPSAEARDEAERVADRIPDTLFLDNQLVVESTPELTRTQAQEDEAIAARLKGVFSVVEDLADIEVTVTSGVVHLKGKVLDHDAMVRAVTLAQETEGVLFLQNDLSSTTDLRARLAPTIDDTWEELRGLLAQLPLFVVGVLIIGFFWALGGWISRRTRLLGRVTSKPLLQSTLSRVVRLAFLTIGILIALELLDATGLVGAVVGAAGVLGIALGFAFQDVVENYLAGLLLTLQQPFSKDDFIELGGTSGVVVRLTTRNTLLLSSEGNHIYVPNAEVFKSTLTNYSRNPRRRFDFSVGVGVEEDLREVIATGLKTLSDMEGVLDDPAPQIRIDELGDSSVVMRVYGWVNQVDHGFLAVRTEAIRQIKQAFEGAGYDLPEPIYRVTVTQGTPKRPAPTPSPGPAIDLRANTELVDQVQEERDRETDQDLLG